MGGPDQGGPGGGGADQRDGQATTGQGGRVRRASRPCLNREARGLPSANACLRVVVEEGHHGGAHEATTAAHARQSAIARTP
eukprot:scaffold209634_cov41-Tisochrysis_lutea.AAC.1